MLFSLPASVHYPKQTPYKSQDYQKHLYECCHQFVPNSQKTIIGTNLLPFLCLAHNSLTQHSLKWRELAWWFLEIWPYITQNITKILVDLSKIVDFFIINFKKTSLPWLCAREYIKLGISQSKKKPHRRPFFWSWYWQRWRNGTWFGYSQIKFLRLSDGPSLDSGSTVT